MNDASFERLSGELELRGHDREALIRDIQRFTIETPSWGYGDSGTRFKVFHGPGAAHTLREKLANAAQVQKVTGICPSVAIHIPWDWEDDWRCCHRTWWINRPAPANSFSGWFFSHLTVQAGRFAL